jgi:SAM-dependent methyltransferase
MRAAVKLMGLGMTPAENSPPVVMADLGCGDGEFLISLLKHVNSATAFMPAGITGVGVDYSPSLIASAASKATLASQSVKWLTYDFNLDESDLASQLLQLGVTHMFVYLIPKQLTLKTVRGILENLLNSGVVICCYKFLPAYLQAVRVDEVMNLAVYEREETG